MPFSLINVLSQPSLHILIWEEDGAYIAKCLDIPGCVSQGNTREEALGNIRDAISQCLEVIQEDANKPQDPLNSVELIERPLSEFIEAR
ncbi:MAG: type II toxin-antitoxin system HicB family antitoxin [Bryobacteraceae bacterium]|jgi:predicted RNase H-like HicB family nuclease